MKRLALALAVLLSAHRPPPDEQQFREELRRMLATEDSIRARIREALVPLGQRQQERNDARAHLARTSAAVADVDRRIQAVEAGYRRQRAHYADTLAMMEADFKRLEDQILAGPADRVSHLIPRYDELKASLERMRAQVEVDRRRRGVTERLEALQRERTDAVQHGREAAEAVDAAERGVADAQWEVDRHVAHLDEEIRKRQKFEADAPEYLRGVLPPFLREMEVKTEGGEVRYRARWENPDEQERQLEEEIKVCREMIDEELDLLATLRRDFQTYEDELVASNDRWQALNTRYATRVEREALWRIVLESADSVSEIFIGSGGNPVAILVGAGVELAGRLVEAKYGPKPAFANFPELPAEWIAARQGMAGNPAAEAAARFGLPVPAGLTNASPTGTNGNPLDALGANTAAAAAGVTKNRIKEVIVQIVKDPEVRRMAAELGKLIAVDAQIFRHLVTGGANRDWMRMVHRMAVAQRGEIWRAMRQHITRTEFKQGIKRSLLISLGKMVVKEGAMYQIAQERVEIFAEMFQEELVWFAARREYYFTSAQIRFERRRLQMLREILAELIALRGQGGPTRLRRVLTNAVCRDGMYEMTLRFSGPVTSVQVEIPESANITPLRTADGGATHVIRFQLPRLSPDNRLSRIRVEAKAPLTEKALDSDPASIPAFSDRWNGYEAGPDRNHSIKLRDDPDAVSIVFLFDGSGSMAENNRMTRAKEAAIRILRDDRVVRRGDEVALWIFNSGTPALALEFTDDRERAAAQIQGFGTGGSTPLARSIVDAGTYLLRRGQFPRKILVVLSDGVETDGGDPAAALELLRRRAVEIRLEGR